MGNQKKRRGNKSSNFGVRRFIEICGEHPFATGLFAITGIIGTLFSFYTYFESKADQEIAQNSTLQINNKLNSIEKEIKIASPESDEAAKEIPLKISFSSVDFLSNQVGDIIFDDKFIDKDRTWIAKHSEEAFTSTSFFNFSISSEANKHFIQTANYLIIDLQKVEPIPQSLACIYEGGYGDGGDVREFRSPLTKTPGIHYAPLIADNGEYDSQTDFFSLEPGEIEEFAVTLKLQSGFIYTFRVGIPVKFNNVYDIVWIDHKFRMGIPEKELAVKLDGDEEFSFHQHPALENYEEIDFTKASDKSAKFAAQNLVFKPHSLGLK